MKLLRLVAILLIIGVVLFDAGAVLVNRVQTDELAQRALRSAVNAAQSPEGRRPEAVVASATAGLSRSDRARLVSATLDAAGLTVVVSMPAEVLVLDRLGPLSDLATATVTKTALSG
jgi:hypothetical protein